MILMLYYLVLCVFVPTLLKTWAGVPDEFVRKSQHMAYSFSIFLMFRLFESWYAAVVGAFSLVIVGYPALMVAEKFRWYKKLLVDRTRKGGELRKQLLYVQLSFAVMLFIFWGLLGTDWRYLAAVAVMAWGFGDAAAALVGKYLGTRNVVHRLVEGTKTYEGTGAMAVAAGLALFISLLVYGQSVLASLAIAIIVAPVCALIELFSRRGSDTLTVPLATAFMVLPLVHFFSWMRW